ncbi:MAG: DUF58 domain-containing protein [Acidimicrobiia bacterium]|nr:DUF58 domain-containing protein [Acidimicrobiia bacterium]
MPTGRGWAAVGVAAALLVLWIAFGEVELMTTAVFLLAAVVIGTAFVRITRPNLTLSRHIYPTQSHEGDTVSIEIELSASRRLRNLWIEDTVHGLGVARFAAAATPSIPAMARYEVHCRSRGVFAVGPAEVAILDPFGLNERRSRAGGTDRLTVYPRIEPLIGLPVVRGLDPVQQAIRPTFAPHSGEDFFTLREYQVGDDLRRVHWPSSAKRDTLIIKQLEIPWQSRALVLLDVRAECYPGVGAFEQAVRGAAATLAHLHKGSFAPELWTTQRSGPRSGDRYHQSMDTLATVQPVANLDHRRTVSRLRRKGAGGGVLVFVTGIPDEGALTAFQVLANDFARTIVMVVTDRAGDGAAPFRQAGALTVMSRPGGSWAPGWRTAMESSWSTASVG